MSSQPAADAGVLIVGGGIAGLALARYLTRLGYDPTVVEQAGEWRATGYGIGLRSDGLAVLAELGRRETVRERATDPDGFEIRGADGRLLTRATLPPDRTPLLVVHRADLHAALRSGVADDRIRMGTRPERIAERCDGVDATFDDGTRERFDLVVGADGVHSTVRRECFTDWTLHEHDTYVWSCWGASDVDLGRDLVSVWEAGTEGFVARVDDRVGFNLAARLDAPPDPPALGELRARTEAVGWKLPELLDGAAGEPFFDRIRTVACDRWHTDRVVLIGDAAHAVHPISGMGASLALQDARALTQELATARPPDGGVTEGGFDAALDRFEERRHDAARRVQRRARAEAAVAFVESDPLRRLRDGLAANTPFLGALLGRWLAK